MIIADNINKKYGNLQVLKNVSVQVEHGEIISIVGASGAGKSTLLHILGTIDKADSGKIFIDNTDVSKLNDKKLSAFRNKKIGFVFQFHHLLPEFTTFENICIPAMIAGTPKKVYEKRAIELMDFLNITPRKDHKPSELSGGEQQRVAVARALINEPVLVFADEPSGNLDSANAQDLHQLFFNLRKHYSQTFVIVTHNEQLAQMADRIITMKDGQIV